MNTDTSASVNIRTMGSEVLPDFTEIAPDVYVAQGRTCVGILAGPSGRCLLVDTGPSDTDWSLGLDALLRSEALLPHVIINTHTHADHCGSNSYFIRNYRTEVACTPLEAIRAKEPIIEPIMVFGAVPPENLMTKFFLFEPFETAVLLEPARRTTEYTRGIVPHAEYGFGDIEVDVVALSGHTPGHIGVGRDKVLFVGDALIPSAGLVTNPIPVYWDVGAAIRTLVSLKHLVAKRTYPVLVCAHGGRLADPMHDLGIILERVRDVLWVLVERADEGDMVLDSAVDSLVRCWGMNLNAPTEYFLVRSAVASYLAHLVDLKILRMIVRGSRLVWLPSTKRPSFERIISQEMGEGGEVGRWYEGISEVKRDRQRRCGQRTGGKNAVRR